MKSKTAIVAALVSSLVMPASFALAADSSNEQQQVQAQDQERIYGSQMMTEQERNEYRARMQAAKTNEEREQIRMEHHERMQERAREHGMMMPDSPPPRGAGMGNGMGPGTGGGMGPGMGNGMGSGMGGGMGHGKGGKK